MPSNLLVLDEPTNDLDIETLDLLQELLADYPGTILLVSHDRDFLDRVVTSVLVAEGGGRWVEYAGGYSDMVAQRGYGLSGPPAPEAQKPEKPAVRETARQPAKRKMSFNEKHALETLPGRIEALQARSRRWSAGSPIPDCTHAIPRVSRARRSPTRPSAPSGDLVIAG